MAEPVRPAVRPWSESHIADLRSYHQPCGWSCKYVSEGRECDVARWLATLDALRASLDPDNPEAVKAWAAALHEVTTGITSPDVDWIFEGTREELAAALLRARAEAERP